MLVRLATDKDEEAWNHFSSHHPDSSPYHHFGWKKSIEKSYNHTCYYLIAENKDQEIIGVLPTASIKLPFISGNLFSLPFCDLGAPLALDEKTSKALITLAKKLAVEHKLTSFQLRSFEKQSENSSTRSFSSNQKVRMLLDLPDTSESLFSSFKSKLRSQIRKAKKNGLTINIGHNNQLVEDFFEVFTQNMRDLGSPTHSKSWFSEIISNYGKDSIISVISHQGRAVGAGIVLFHGSKAAIPWASTIREFNRLSPNMLLYWSLLEYSTDHGYKNFDFGRSTYGEGTYKFKQQWGAKPLPLSWQTYSLKPTAENKPTNETRISSQSQLRRFFETAWQRLPLPVSVFLGPKIRKYIPL